MMYCVSVFCLGRALSNELLMNICISGWTSGSRVGLPHPMFLPVGLSLRMDQVPEQHTTAKIFKSLIINCVCHVHLLSQHNPGICVMPKKTPQAVYSDASLCLVGFPHNPGLHLYVCDHIHLFVCSQLLYVGRGPAFIESPFLAAQSILMQAGKMESIMSSASLQPECIQTCCGCCTLT